MDDGGTRSWKRDIYIRGAKLSNAVTRSSPPPFHSILSAFRVSRRRELITGSLFLEFSSRDRDDLASR